MIFEGYIHSALVPLVIMYISVCYTVQIEMGPKMFVTDCYETIVLTSLFIKYDNNSKSFKLLPLFSGTKDLVSKEDKAGKLFQRAFQEYSSRLYIIKEALKQGMPDDIA